MDISKDSLERLIEKMLIVVFDLLCSLDVEYPCEHATYTIHLLILYGLILLLYYLLD